jgi:SAM-dependent methyltransferase
VGESDSTTPALASREAGAPVGASTRSAAPDDWRLVMFRQSLKKRQKLELLLRMMGPVEEERCLLVTCGDNTGAMNHHFRQAGGRWSWAEMEGDRIPEMAAFLSESVHHATPERMPFPDGHFHRVVVIDVHEHLEAGELETLNRELARVLAPEGTAILTTPNGDGRLPLAVVKGLLGMTPRVYGHQVQGYTVPELQAMARGAGLVPEAWGAYSRFFTEGIELAINFAYVKVLGRKGGGGGAPKEGEIAPSSSSDLSRVGGAYRLYSKVYPLLRALSRLDLLIPGKGGYAVAVAARKPRESVQHGPTG